ncbi:MAG: discoidin domain-containing protein, partial [Nanoarchaeota archaeon]|nr:discoidin domain-containing protein [Nanoarchaeota archaeon]
DNDADGYDKEEVSCSTGNDCNDNDPNVNPGQVELCGDEIDNNCNGEINEGCEGICDTDQDEYDEFWWCIGGGPNTDCDDDNPSINPGVSEVCDNNVDDDCDELIDCDDSDCVNDPICVSTSEKLRVIFAVDNADTHQTENPIENSYDDTLSTRWAAHQSANVGTMNVDVSITFDLGGVQEVYETKFSPYRWNLGRIYQYNVEGSLDGVVWTTVVSSKASLVEQWTNDSFTPIQIQYVRMNFETQSENYWAGLFEFEIWGVELNPPVNQAPIVDAGPDRSIYISQSAQLSGVVSDDGLPDPPGEINVQWSKVSGLGTITFDNAYVASTTATFSLDGEYVLKLLGDDGELNSEDTMTVNVAVPVCGNGQCEPGEDVNNCPEDCESGVGFLPSDRSIDWNPGIPGGIPNYPNSNIDVMGSPYNAVGNGVADDTQAIQSALNAMAQQKALYLPQGEYLITSEIDIPQYKVLRGAGMFETKIICDSGTCIEMTDWRPDPDISVTENVAQGSFEIKVSSLSGISVGEYLEIRQDNDPELFACGYSGCSSWTQDRSMGQVALIESINSATNTITLNRPAYLNYKTSLNPKVKAEPGYKFAGIEDLFIDKVEGSSGSNINMAGAVHCWVKNVWSNMAYSQHVNMVDQTFGSEIRDSVFSDAWVRGSGGQGYGVTIEGRSSDNLIINSIFAYLRHSMVLSDGSSGNVFAYSYSKDPWGANSYNETINWLFTDLLAHGNYPNMNLFEGNEGQKIATDNVHGTNGPTTFFRNRIPRVDGHVTNLGRFSHIDVSGNNYNHNLIGNELGLLGQTTEDGVINLHSDGAATILVHGNYNYLDGAFTNWESSLGGESTPIPNSMFLEGKPSWWPIEKPWPAYGPEYINSGNTIPAVDRYYALTESVVGNTSFPQPGFTGYDVASLEEDEKNLSNLWARILEMLGIKK